MRRTSEAAALAGRMCRPQRIGVFGYRGVGKTTLLAMLYREAVGGRLPDLRLAAADARTADYLSDKVLQLEAGQTLPGTLAETELRFQLYHRDTRIELLVKDYQGEHVELGRSEPIQEFLRDCDAAWFCLDAATVLAPAERLRRQQEVEQLIEDYLAQESSPTMERPVALLLTKADLLGPDGDNKEWAESYFGMTRHSLASHCPRSGLFAVSSLGRGGPATDSPEAPPPLQPRNLAEPLAWLATALQGQDEARLERLWSLAGTDLALLERCVSCFARRYPQAAATAVYRQRLQALRQRRARRRRLVGSTAAACLVAFLWCYDALGYQRAARFEVEHAENPVATLQEWQSYRLWHPTRNLLRPGAARAEEEQLEGLSQRAHDFQRAEQLAQLRRRSADPDADPEAAWQQFCEFRTAYPEAGDAAGVAPLRDSLKARRDEYAHRRAQAAYDQLLRAEQDGVDLSVLVAHADQFLRDHADGGREADVRRRRDAYVRRLEEKDFEVARNYSGRQPLNFQTRREHYQRYLDKHPRGLFGPEAEAALRAIEKDWDKHDFRAVRDLFVAHPGEITELVARCRAYLAVHPEGAFTAAARDLLRWSEGVTVPGEYRVVLRSGQFDKKVARFFSRGPDLSVELEVAGVRYGPSTIVVNRYDPDWDFEFPRRVRWKLGDPVRIRVSDHDYWDRVVIDIQSDDGDPLAVRLLAGDVWCGKNRLTFESDFALPKLPKIE